MMKKVRRIHSLLLAMGMFIIMICFDTPLSVKAAEGGYTYYVMMKTDPTAEYYVENEGLATSLGGLTAGGSPIFTVEKVEDENRWNVMTTDADCTQEEVAGALATVKDQAIAIGTFTGNTLDLGYGALVLIRSRAGVYYISEVQGNAQGLFENPSISGDIIGKNEFVMQRTGNNYAEIGKTVNYTITIKLSNKDNETNTLYQVVPSGLTFNPNLTTVTGGNLTSNDSFSWNESNNSENKNQNGKEYTMDISSLESGKGYVITCTATVNKNATAGTPMKVQASIKNTDQSGSVSFYTYDFKLKVTDKSSNSLSGAQFTLRNSKGEYYTPPTDATSETDARFQSVTQGKQTPTVTTDNDGMIEFHGLAAGYYILTETEAATGFEKLNDSITVTIGQNGSLSVNSVGGTVPGTLTVINEHEMPMPIPNTGGTGTTVFYVLGGLFMLSAGTLLVLRRRRSA